MRLKLDYISILLSYICVGDDSRIKKCIKTKSIYNPVENVKTFYFDHVHT